jgi:myo-inositol-1(or 4)-monophosphatase
VTFTELTQHRDDIIRIAEETGRILLRGVRRKKKIRFKGEVDLVTQYDTMSQRFIVKELRRRYPDYGILSEEKITRNVDFPRKWIVDPLDGTTNFAHGLPIWSVTIALEVDGKILTGIVYDPTRGELFSAVKHKGALLNKHKIQVSKTKKLSRALLVTGFPYDIRTSKDNNLDHFSDFAVRAQAVRRLGSAAMDLCYTACGRFDGYWEKKLSPWDQAAGSLILKEAGGNVTDFNGGEFDIYGDEVLGTNGLLHKQMMKVLYKRDTSAKPSS